MIEPNLHIMVFGQLTDITGTEKLAVPMVPDADALKTLLTERYPALAGASYVIAIDKKLVSGNPSISASSTIALLPPFSGG